MTGVIHRAEKSYRLKQLVLLLIIYGNTCGQIVKLMVHCCCFVYVQCMFFSPVRHDIAKILLKSALNTNL
jgi:hypothetical protein